MKAHWTPRYFLDRTREAIFHRMHPNAPWLGPEAVQVLGNRLKPHFMGLEAGAGRSTPWIARRVRRLVSLEESEAWLVRVRKRVAKAGLHNVTLQRVEGSDDRRTKNYLAAIAAMPDESIDFATVDSEHDRAAIALALLPKLKPGAFLMLDNANWFLPSHSRSPASRSKEDGPLNDEWALFAKSVDTWECRWTSSGVTDTAFFFRPADA